MATLFRRENGVYYLKWVDVTTGKDRRVSTKATNRRDAQRVKRAFEELHTEMIAERRTRETLTFLDAWKYYEAALGPQKKAKTLYNERIAWDQFALWCSRHGVKTIDSVRVGDVALWQADMLAAGRSPVGLNTYMRMCKLVYGHLIRLEKVTYENPFRKVRMMREVRKTKYLDWPDIERLVETAKRVSRDIHLVFVLGAYGGLRKAEILAARWEHVEWEKGQLLVEGTKSAASRNYIPLHQALHDGLLAYYPEHGQGYIVAPRKEPTMALNAYRWNWRKQWAKVEALEVAAAAEDGREPVHATPHQLRHSVATHLLDMGYTIQQVAVFLRHANDVPTRRYADLKGVELTIDKF